jgi:N-ethylmaleimide reductase
MIANLFSPIELRGSNPGSPAAQGYISTPGIHTAEQVEGWKRVTTPVHCAGGYIFLQLWHVG